MDKYFGIINEYLFSLLNDKEILKVGMWGENSQFIRLNNSKIRQTGIIDDMSYSISLISNNRQVSCSTTLNGKIDYDKQHLKNILNALRDDILKVPEDPYIVYPTTGDNTNEKNKGHLLDFDKSERIVSTFFNLFKTTLFSFELFIGTFI